MADSSSTATEKPLLNKWLILLGCSFALSMLFVDQTALPIALPVLQGEFDLSIKALQWVMNGYFLSYCVMILLGGKIGDHLGHKRTFLLGVWLYLFSSVICALSQSYYAFVMSRAVHGIAGAVISPNAGVIVINAFDEKKKGKAFGFYVASASVFLSLGPILGGAMVQYLSWRWIFWINVPISFLSILFISRFHPKERAHEQLKGVDWLGFAISCCLITLVVLTLSESLSTSGFSRLFSLLMITSLLIFFILSQKNKQAKAFVNLEMLKIKSYLYSNLSMFCIQFMFVSIYFWPLLMQNIMGYSAIETGLFFLPLTIPALFMAPLSGTLRDRYGAKIPATIGSFSLIAGSLWIAIFAIKKTYLWILPAFVLYGIGAPFVFSSTNITAITSVAPSMRGSANSLYLAMKQLGRAVGYATLNSLLIHSPLLFVEENGSKAELTHNSGTDFIFGFKASMTLAAFIAFLGLIFSFFIPRPKRKKEQTELIEIP